MPPFYTEPKFNEPLPKSFREIPHFLKALLSHFGARFFYIVKLVWETRKWILIAMAIIAVLQGVLPIIGSLISAELLNRLADAYVTGTLTSYQPTFAEVLGSPAFAGILVILVMQMVYLFARKVLETVNTAVSRVSGELVVNHIRLKIMRKAQELDLASFDMPEFYSKLENANREAGIRPIQVLSSTFKVVSTVISIVGFVILLCAVSPIIPLLMLVLAIPGAVVNMIYRKKHFRYIRHHSKERRELRYFSDQMVDKDKVKEIRIFGLSGTFIERYNGIFRKYFAGLRKLFYNECFWHVAIDLCVIVVDAALFAVIAYEVWIGRMQIGDYSLYTGALTSIVSGVSTLIATTSTVYEGTLFIDNLIEFMREKCHLVPKVEKDEKPLSVKRHIGHTIEFRGVSFRYPGTNRDVLKNINLTFKAGDTVMLVGLNGAGKTTLIKLLTRLYDPTEGVILLDGEDIRRYDLAELYRMYGIIFQDFGKYAVSVQDNIVFGEVDKPVVEAAVHEAADRSAAAGFIERLPDGYQTPLMRYFEENGVELSIGQWQKLSVARAFYSDSDVLILDEPTASLDALAEQEIYRQFDQLRRDKTTIIVSHRLSSATTASLVVVLQNGEVIEQGTHAELMAHGGSYYELFTAQASRYRTETE